MDQLVLLSYRGVHLGADGRPKAGGGVSTGLTTISDNEGCGWYYFDDNEFSFLENGAPRVKKLARFSHAEIEEHYGFCNRTLWPLDHDLEEYIRYSQREREQYRRLQSRATSLVAAREKKNSVVFVQDYQYNLAPEMLRQAGLRSLFFLHTPFPQYVKQLYRDVVIEMVRGMLGADTIGFHCRTYADAFLRFAAQNVPGLDVDVDLHSVTSQDGHRSQIVVEPLGIDVENWRRLASVGTRTRTGTRKKVFLVVARADYTKGIPELLEAWYQFNRLWPELAQDCLLKMIVTPSRDGIEEFRGELSRIERAYQKVVQAFPGSVEWQQTASAPSDLAVTYANSDCLLIAPKVDGWNLTGPEFISSQPEGSGAVVGMSSGTGAYQRFGDYVIELHAEDPLRMAYALHYICGLIGSDWAISRMQLMRQVVPGLGDWWRNFKSLAGL